MAAKLCQQCESRGGLQHMIGEVSQKFITNVQNEITVWTCPFCGFTETETNVYDSATASGAYNSGIGYVMTQNQGPSS
jgi:hypothetical protein